MARIGRRAELATAVEMTAGSCAALSQRAWYAHDDRLAEIEARAKELLRYVQELRNTPDTAPTER